MPPQQVASLLEDVARHDSNYAIVISGILVKMQEWPDEKWNILMNSPVLKLLL
jgi:hypothetical protein